MVASKGFTYISFNSHKNHEVIYYYNLHFVDEKM